MTAPISTQIHLVSRPDGWPTPEDFNTVAVPLEPLADGEVRVRNEFVSVDPYMRGRMNLGRSYVPPFELDQQITGAAVGRVVESRNEALPVGSPVTHSHGWSDIAQDHASTFQAVTEQPGLPLSVFLNILGSTGLTAYTGLIKIAHMREGDTVFISGAAGAVGTAAGQIAKLLGAGRVVGSAGSAEKVALVTEKYGYDAAFNYKDPGSVAEKLHQVAPDGIDVYFDNVGGEHLEAAIGAFNDGGRAALCGAITGYNTGNAEPGPRNMFNFITRGLTMQGFTQGNYRWVVPEFTEQMTQWIREGAISYEETIVDGIENTVEAFLGMMRGRNTGKMLVRVRPMQS